MLRARMRKKISIVVVLLLLLTSLVVINLPKNSSSIVNNQNFSKAPKELVLTYKNVEQLSKEVGKIKTFYKIGIKPEVNPYKVFTQGNKMVIKFPLLADGDYQVLSESFKINFTVGKVKLEKLVDKPSRCLIDSKINTVCLSRYYENLTIKSGPGKALSNLDEFIQENPSTVFTCHDWTHAIGIASAAYYQNFEIAFGKGTPACQYGYYHGVQEGFAMRMSNSHLKALVPNLCNQVTFGYNSGSCIHGVGHMVWYRTNEDFLGSIEYCKLLPATPSEMYRPRDACAAGVAMNWGDKYRYGSKKVREILLGKMRDPTDICKTILDDAKLRAGCYGFIGHVWSANKKGIFHLVTICQSLPSIESRACWLNIGFEIGFIPDASLDEAISTCGLANTDPAMWSCLGNVVSQSTVATLEIGAAKKACDLAKALNRYSESKCREMKEQEKARMDPVNATIIEHVHI